jgi:hypothetical protein
MHKVKDAMTDRDKDADRFNEPGQESYGSSNAPTNTNTNPSGKTNPFGSTRSGDGATRHTRFNGEFVPIHFHFTLYTILTSHRAPECR